MGGLLLAVFIGACILCFVMIRQAFGNKVARDVLEFENFPEGMKDLNVFFISDIHRRIVDCRIIQEVNGEPDIVIIGGDLTEKGVPFSRVENNLEKLSKLGPLYFIWGNNDYEVDAAKLNTLFKKYHVTELKNEAIHFAHSDSGILLVGLDFDDSPGAAMKAILHSINDHLSFRILLSHHPIIAKDVEESDQISLILSGHTHGGQIRIFGMGPYKKGGIRKLDHTTLLVSNGYGTSLLPLRLGAPAETHLLTLRRASGNNDGCEVMNHPAAES